MAEMNIVEMERMMTEMNIEEMERMNNEETLAFPTEEELIQQALNLKQSILTMKNDCMEFNRLQAQLPDNVEFKEMRTKMRTKAIHLLANIVECQNVLRDIYFKYHNTQMEETIAAI